jgi:glycosyltransferase involved in cell wall biosynthesis
MTPSTSRSGSSDPLRALHVTAGNLFGGIERMLLTIAATPSSDARHEMALSVDGRLAAALRARGREPHVLGAARFSRPDTVWRARRALGRVLASQRPAALIAHAPWSYALAAPVARRRGVPLLLWVHDAPRADAFLERRVAARPPETLICNSRYIAGLAGAWLPRVPSLVIYPPVEPRVPGAETSRAALRAQAGATDQTTVILLASRLEPYKGHRLLLEAAARLRGDVAVWIAGGAQRPHEADYLASLTADAERHLPDRVRFLGERNDVPDLMAAADIFCQPNTQPEPFGIVFAEALAARVPVVTTAMGGAVEIVNGCGVLVDEPAAAPLAAALQRLIDDPALRASLGAGGPAHAARLTDPAARLRQLDDLVQAHARRTAA